MDIERTKQFYRELKQSDLCGCAYCRNYVKEAAKAYPAVTAYLQTLGVDIAKPFETMPLELDEDGRMPYIGPQYLTSAQKRALPPRRSRMPMTSRSASRSPTRTTIFRSRTL